MSIIIICIIIIIIIIIFIVVIVIVIIVIVIIMRRNLMSMQPHLVVTPLLFSSPRNIPLNSHRKLPEWELKVLAKI